MSQKQSKSKETMKLIGIMFALLLSACATQTEAPQPAIEAPPTADELLLLGSEQLNQAKPELAQQTLLQAQQLCDEQYGSVDEKVFITRTPDTRFYYLLIASYEQTPTSVIASPCAEVSYLLGYTYVELGDLTNAERYVTLATEYSPANPAYLTELAYLHQRQGDIQTALTLYQRAEETADNFSPVNLRDEELGRAKRGIGYCLIALGKLEEAESKFLEALRLNANDFKALDELRYIQSLASPDK